eukprot:UN05754
MPLMNLKGRNSTKARQPQKNNKPSRKHKLDLCRVTSDRRTDGGVNNHFTTSTPNSESTTGILPMLPKSKRLKPTLPTTH